MAHFLLKSLIMGVKTIAGRVAAGVILELYSVGIELEKTM